MSHAKDWTGIKLHRITFLRKTEKRSSTKVVWDAICDCGKEFEVIPGAITHGNIRSCGCQKRIISQQLTFEPRIMSARQIWRHVYKECGGVDFDIFLNLSQLPCKYCGLEPQRTFNVAASRLSRGKKLGHNVNPLTIQNGDFTYNGLDRIDSSLGHTIENCVPCCFTCNRMKCNMGLQDFIAHINRIAKHNVVELHVVINPSGS